MESKHASLANGFSCYGDRFQLAAATTAELSDWCISWNGPTMHGDDRISVANSDSVSCNQDGRQLNPTDPTRHGHVTQQSVAAAVASGPATMASQFMCTDDADSLYYSYFPAAPSHPVSCSIRCNTPPSPTSSFNSADSNWTPALEQEWVELGEAGWCWGQQPQQTQQQQQGGQWLSWQHSTGPHQLHEMMPVSFSCNNLTRMSSVGADSTSSSSSSAASLDDDSLFEELLDLEFDLLKATNAAASIAASSAAAAVSGGSKSLTSASCVTAASCRSTASRNYDTTFYSPPRVGSAAAVPDTKPTPTSPTIPTSVLSQIFTDADAAAEVCEDTHELDVVTPPPVDASSDSSRDGSHDSASDDIPSPTPVVKRRRKRQRQLWTFLMDTLNDSRYSPAIIEWIQRDDGVFRFVEPRQVAQLWGQKRHRTNMTYENLSRAMRYYYNRGVMRRVADHGRLVYQFLTNSDS